MYSLGLAAGCCDWVNGVVPFLRYIINIALNSEILRN